MHLHFLSKINVNFDKQNAESNQIRESGHSFQIRRMVAQYYNVAKSTV
jgi:hypothetical protein